jgi:hypothetical protein
MNRAREAEIMAQAPESNTIKNAIIDLLRARGNEASLLELLDGLRDKGVRGDAEVKRAIWPLLSEDVLELTDQRKLRLVQRP